MIPPPGNYAAGASKVIQAYFHAAAFTGRTIEHVLEWIAPPTGTTEPGEILREHPHAARFWAGLLQALLLRRRLEALDDSLEMHRKGLAKARATGIVEQYLVEVDREHALLRADRDWLSAFIDRLVHPDFVWGTHVTDDRYLAQREAARQ